MKSGGVWPLWGHIMTEAAERDIIRHHLAQERELDAGQRERIAACYLEHMSAEQAAWRVHLSARTTRMIYYRLAMALVRNAFTGVISS